MSSQKELGIQLPPLLPLEYCTVERAARLLGCEVEDIHHWNEIGAVKLYAYFQKRVPGKIEISMLNIRGKEEQHPRAYLKEVAEKTSDQYKKVRDSILSLHKENTLIAKVFEYYLVGDREILPAPMHIRSENGTAVWNADRCCADFKGFKADAQIMDFWELYSFKHSQPDDQNIELISDDVKASWGDDLQSVKVSVDKGLWNGRLYLLRRDILKVHKATHGIENLPNRYNDSAIDKEIKERNREPEVLFTRFKTSQDTRGIALGVMAKLIAQSKPNKLIRGGKVNASELVKMMEQECARLGIGSLSGEVRKDISQCVDAVEKEINKKTYKSVI